MLPPRAAYPDEGAIRFRRVRDFGQILSATFALLRERAGELFRGLLFIAGPALLLAGVASALAQREILEGGQVGGAAVASTLVGLLAGSVLIATVFAYLRLYRRGQAGGVTTGELWDETKGLILPVAVVGVLYSVLFALALLPVVALAGGLAALGGVGGAIVAAVLGLAIAFVALAVVLPAALVAYPVRVFEEEGAFASVSRAVRLVWSRKGLSFAVTLLTGILVLLLAVVVSLPVILFQGLDAVTGELADGRMPPLLAVLNQLLTGLLYPIPLVAGAFLYESIAEGAEGSALDADLAAFETAGSESREAYGAGSGGGFGRGYEASPPSDQGYSPPDQALSPLDGEVEASETSDRPETDGGEGRPGGGFRGGGFGG